MPMRKRKPIEERDDYAGAVMRAFDALAAPAAHPVRTCRGCGCDDHHACITAEGPCAWVLLDVETPTGICSACATDAGWDQRFLALADFAVRPC